VIEKEIFKCGVQVDAPILVLCQSCGVMYEFTVAKGLCPLCGSKDHRSVIVALQIGSKVLEERK